MDSFANIKADRVNEGEVPLTATHILTEKTEIIRKAA
jgi:hypothetical protein